MVDDDSCSSDDSVDDLPLSRLANDWSNAEPSNACIGKRMRPIPMASITNTTPLLHQPAKMSQRGRPTARTGQRRVVGPAPLRNSRPTSQACASGTGRSSKHGHINVDVDKASRYDDPDDLRKEFLTPIQINGDRPCKRKRRLTGMDQSGVDAESSGLDELGMLFAAEEAREEEKEECVSDNEALGDVPYMMESDDECNDAAEMHSATSRRGRTLAQTAKTVKMGVMHMKHHAQKTNTRRAYGPKWNQYLDFCRNVYGSNKGIWWQSITHDRVYNFMFYQCMRSNSVQARRAQKKNGGKVSGRVVTKFDFADYRRVMDKFQGWLDGYLDTMHERDRRTNEMRMPMCDYPLGFDTLNHYRCAIKYNYDRHVYQGQNSLRWDEIWTSSIDEMINLAVERIPLAKKRRHEEKIDHMLDPYLLVNRFDTIERAIWEHGESNMRSAFSWLRHRYIFLHSTHGILRCESIFNGELSDCLALRAEGNPHHMWVLVQQLAQGKTVKAGKKLFGRVMRHKDVNVCGFGAFAMYLAMRFHITEEFTGWSVNDWFDNKLWFDIKLLVDAHGARPDFEKSMTNVTYGRAIKQVLRELRLPSTHYVHLGRKLGALDLELLGIPGQDIDDLGNWNRTIRLQSYSGKIPMNPIMAKARYRGRLLNQPDVAPVHFNVRQGVIVPEELLALSPLSFGKRFLDPLREQCIKLKDERIPKTALSFLKLVHLLNITLIQDLAALAVVDPSRLSHPIYGSFQFMRHAKWPLFKEQMGAAIVAEKDRLASSQIKGIDHYLPGVNAQFDGLYAEVAKANTQVSQVSSMLEETKTGVSEGIVALREIILGAAQGALSAQRGTRQQPTCVPQCAVVAPAAHEGLAQTMALPSIRVQSGGGRKSRFDMSSDEPPPSDQIPRPKSRFDNLDSIWSWWNEEAFPLEERYPSGLWRECPARYSPSEQKNFSRLKRVVDGVKGYAEKVGCSKEVAVRALEETYKTEARQSLERMVRWLKDHQYLCSSVRPGKRVEEDPSSPGN